MKNCSWMFPFVMAIAGSGGAMAAGGPVLYCDPAAASQNVDIYRAACAEVVKEVKLKFPSVTVREGATAAKPDGNVIRLDILKISRHAIAGRLAWSSSKNATAGYVLGPVITTTISDAALNDRSLREFASGLVGASKIQFPKP